MKKFSFKLKTPLKVKRLIEDVKKLELARALSNKFHEETVLHNMKETREHAEKKAKQILTDLPMVGDIQGYPEYLQRLGIEVDFQKDIVYGVTENYEIALKGYMASRTERETLEKLKERQLFRYSMEVNRDEQRQSDELAINSFKRQKGDL